MRRTAVAVAALAALLGSGCARESSDEPAAATTVPDSPSTEADPTTTARETADDGRAAGEGCDDAPIWAVHPLRKLQAQPDDDCQTEREPAPEPELGVGDVQITLRWGSESDLDLHVIEPDGTEIWYGDRGPTSTGGRLDVDSNVGCELESSVENVYWPRGRMPTGEFTVRVVGFSVQGCGSGDYTVTAQVDGRQVLDEAGRVGEDEEDSYSFQT